MTKSEQNRMVAWRLWIQHPPTENIPPHNQRKSDSWP